MNFDITVIERFWQLLLSGVPVILGLSLASAFFGTLIGLATVFQQLGCGNSGILPELRCLYVRNYACRY